MSAAILIALATAAPDLGGAMTLPPDPERIRPARDGNIAIAEELCAARRARTVEAYDLFIARHPSHPLAETARRERAALAAGERRR